MIDLQKIFSSLVCWARGGRFFEVGSITAKRVSCTEEEAKLYGNHQAARSLVQDFSIAGGRPGMTQKMAVVRVVRLP